MAERRYEEIVRLMDTDLDGNRSLAMALKEIKGISSRLSRAVLVVSGVDSSKKLKEISEDQIKKIEEIIREPIKAGIPVWMLNRRKDIETGNDIHLVSSDLDFAKKGDIDRMKKIRSWKGVRHTLGQPVRGQSTRSSFRVSGMVIGVSRKAAKAAAAPAPVAGATTAEAVPAAKPVAGAKPTAGAKPVAGAKPTTAKPEAKTAAKPVAKPEAKK
ncbi:MAG: 30S ribosomal protein S13 [Candidatus Aenigmatarchaeota archaeon]